MQTTYQTMASKGGITISGCLKVISSEIDKHGGEIAFGNTQLVNKNGVPMLAVRDNKFVELYSEDGYETLEDIANWADVVKDYSACKAAGNSKYSVTWNL